ncbi:MAG: 30S ribosome-binding factor RbfA [Phycisphaerae bacterium]|nr:30S ribosome-binding factor RbfA [Phycisphaerae bacterium]
MSHRKEQLAATIDRSLRAILARGLQDPRVRGLITVTGVVLTPDLRSARVKVSILPEDAQRLTFQGLVHAAPHLKHQLGEALDLRRTPDLIFELDESLKRQAAVLRDLARAAAVTPAAIPAPADPTPDGEPTP